MDLDSSNIDEYYETAVQIFGNCGVETSSEICVDALMKKFSPFFTDKSQYNQLLSILDPDKVNPLINVSSLARALNQYSDSQATKVDLDESFNLRSGLAPHDSDSGISTDGFQILEELQCELREKAHLAARLRHQLDYTDRQNEEAVSALTAERDSLKTQVQLLREENLSLVHLRDDYEELSERLSVSEKSLADTKARLDVLRAKDVQLKNEVERLENDKLTLQELLKKSKEECHRINEMYASRQSALLGQNEQLTTHCAEMATKLDDKEDLLQQLVKEKVTLEMELKDLLNRSSHTLRLDKSIDFSYSEEQILSALDTLNGDRFVQANQSVEESFTNSLPDHSHHNNMTLFDEIRLSLGAGAMRPSLVEICKNCEKTDKKTITTQTEIEIYNNIQTSCIKCSKCAEYLSRISKLDKEIIRSHTTISDMENVVEKYEANLKILQGYMDEGNETIRVLQSSVGVMQTKAETLEWACLKQEEKFNSLSLVTICAECQTDYDVASVGIQNDLPCIECEKRAPLVENKSWTRYIWEPIKSIFSIIACTSLMAALILLYNVSNYHYASRRCVKEGPSVPWRWFDVQDVMDMLFRIEYVDEVPM